MRAESARDVSVTQVTASAESGPRTHLFPPLLAAESARTTTTVPRPPVAVEVVVAVSGWSRVEGREGGRIGVEGERGRPVEVELRTARAVERVSQGPVIGQREGRTASSQH